MKFATILLIFIFYLRINQLFSGQLAKLPTILDSFNTSNTLIGWESGEWAGSHEVVGKGYIFTQNSQMASIGSIFTSTCHTSQLNSWPNSLASHVVNYSQLSACQGEMEQFEDHPSSLGRPTSLRNKLQQKQTGWATFSINIWLNCQLMCTAIV